MKAIVRDVFGSPDVLRFEEVPTPTPGDNQVCIRVVAVGLNAGDKVLLRGEPIIARPAAGGFFRPSIKVLGAGVAGVVHSVGSGVTSFAVGDEVLVDTSGQKFGGLAEYAFSKEELLVRKPTSMSFTDAAALPVGSTTAIQAVRDAGKVSTGMNVLVVGASGGVGSFAVQFAKHYGAQVTAVCSTRNVEVVKSLGADVVVDYSVEDVAKGSQKFDAIIDTASYRSIADYKPVMNDEAVHVLVGGERFISKIIMGTMLNLFSKKKFRPFLDTVDATTLSTVCDLVESGSVKPLIDKVYSFDKGIEAMRHLDSGHTQGKIVVTM